MSEREVRERLSAAKLWLTALEGGCAPYLSSALFAVPVVLTGEVPTITADDRWRVYVNPDWAVTCDVPQLGSHLAHLLWHLLRDHAGRARSLDVGTADAAAWERAADLTVSETLLAAGHEGLDLPTAAAEELPPHLSVEQYYALLNRLDVSEKPPSGPREGGCGSAADGLPRGYELPQAEEHAIGDVVGGELRKQVAIAFQGHMRDRGSVKGDWARWVEDILSPKVPWRQVLQSSVRRAVAWASGGSDPTYRKLSRRQAASPRTVLPGTRRAVPGIAVVLDTSGSVDDGLLAQALGEVDGVLRALGTAVGGIDVLTCDADVQTAGKVTSARKVQLAGGGGTDMRIGIDAALALRPRPEVVIVLTDGWTPWPSTPPRSASVIAVMVVREHGYPDPPEWITVVESTLD